MNHFSARSFLLGIIVIAMGIVTGITAPTPTTWAQGNSGPSPLCQALNDPALDGHYQIGMAPTPGSGLPLILELYEGETVIIRASNPDIPGGSIVGMAQGALSGITFFPPTPVPGTITYTSPVSQYSFITWVVQGGIPVDWTVSCQGLAGCDAQMPHTPDAAVGRFVTDAPLYWAPGKRIAPSQSIPAGKTAWVLGKDASGDYYQIIWVCDLLWVPVGTMGPDVGDPLWQNTPLPTGVVE